MTPKGSKASGTGRVLEQTIVPALKAKGFEVVSYREWKEHPESFGKELLLTHAPFKTIYEHDGNTEFLLKSEWKQLEIRIECKWQQVAGSVDEKLPYLYLNAIEKMPERHIIVVIDGKGWKPGAVVWLKNAAKTGRYLTGSEPRKRIDVMALAEFVAWANDTFQE